MFLSQISRIQSSFCVVAHSTGARKPDLEAQEAILLDEDDGEE